MIRWSDGNDEWAFGSRAIVKCGVKCIREARETERRARKVGRAAVIFEGSLREHSVL